MSEPTLADLVVAGAYADAFNLAKDHTPDWIHSQLFVQDGRHRDEAMGRFDEFLRYWYEQIEDPYLRALAADTFADTYLTELAPVPNAEFIGANWRTESLRSLIMAISEATLGYDVNEWEKTPESPLPAESAKKWRALGKILAELDLPPAVPLLAPDDAETD